MHAHTFLGSIGFTKTFTRGFEMSIRQTLKSLLAGTNSSRPAQPRRTILGLDLLETRAVPATIVTTGLIRSAAINGGQDGVALVKETIALDLDGKVDTMVFNTTMDPLGEDVEQVYMDVDLFNHKGERKPNGHYETRYWGFTSGNTVLFPNMDLWTTTGKVPIIVRADIHQDAVGTVGLAPPTLMGYNLGNVTFKGYANPLHKVRDNVRLRVTVNGPDIVEMGQPVMQTVKVVNEGPGIAVNTILTVTLPPKTTIDETQTFAGFTRRGQVLTWRLGDMQKGQVELRVMVIPTSSFTKDTTLKLVAQVTTKTRDLMKNDNKVIKFIQVLGPFTPHMIVSQKNLADRTAARGEDVVFTQYSVTATATKGTARPLVYTGSVFTGFGIENVREFALWADWDSNGIAETVVADGIEPMNGRVSFNGYIMDGAGFTIPGGRTMLFELRGTIHEEADEGSIQVGFATNDQAFVMAKKQDGTPLVGVRTNGYGATGQIDVYTGNVPVITVGPGEPGSLLQSIVNNGPPTAPPLSTGLKSLGKFTITAGQLDSQTILGVNDMTFLMNATDYVLQNAFSIQNPADPYNWLVGEAQYLDGTKIMSDTVTGQFRVVFRNIMASDLQSTMMSGGSVTFELKSTVMVAGQGFQATLMTDESFVMRQVYAGGSMDMYGAGLGYPMLPLTKYGIIN